MKVFLLISGAVVLVALGFAAAMVLLESGPEPFLEVRVRAVNGVVESSDVREVCIRADTQRVFCGRPLSPDYQPRPIIGQRVSGGWTQLPDGAESKIASWVWFLRR